MNTSTEMFLKNKKPDIKKNNGTAMRVTCPEMINCIVLLMPEDNDMSCAWRITIIIIRIKEMMAIFLLRYSVIVRFINKFQEKPNEDKWIN